MDSSKVVSGTVTVLTAGNAKFRLTLLEMKLNVCGCYSFLFSFLFSLPMFPIRTYPPSVQPEAGPGRSCATMIGHVYHYASIEFIPSIRFVPYLKSIPSLQFVLNLVSL